MTAKPMKVGPFTVHGLNVEQGLELIRLSQGDDPQAFQNAMILNCVQKNGKPVNNESFAEMVPHFKELVEAAYEMNGFRKDKADG